jgi:hypothetical protein
MRNGMHRQAPWHDDPKLAAPFQQGEAPAATAVPSAYAGPLRFRRQDTLTQQKTARLQDVRQTAALAIRRSSALETQLPLRDNTLHAIPPRPKTQRSSPGHHHCRPPGIRISRSSAPVQVDRNALFS